MQANNLFAFLVLSIGRTFPRIFFVFIHEGLTGVRGKRSPYLIAGSTITPSSQLSLVTALGPRPSLLIDPTVDWIPAQLRNFAGMTTILRLLEVPCLIVGG
jgi:hypothetical protein